MTFKNRLLLYGFGFIVGSIIVYFIWTKKDATFDYLPEARVLKNIQTKELHASIPAKISFVGFRIDSTALSTLISKGKVDFSKSETKTEPCKTYWISTHYNNQKLALIIENCDSIATIQRVIKE